MSTQCDRLGQQGGENELTEGDQEQREDRLLVEPKMEGVGSKRNGMRGGNKLLCREGEGLFVDHWQIMGSLGQT